MFVVLATETPRHVYAVNLCYCRGHVFPLPVNSNLAMNMQRYAMCALIYLSPFHMCQLGSSHSPVSSGILYSLSAIDLNHVASGW
jgi:hypothetical protein